MSWAWRGDLAVEPVELAVGRGDLPVGRGELVLRRGELAEGRSELEPTPSSRLREVTCADKGRGREVSGPVERWRLPWATVLASLLLNPSLSLGSLEPQPRWVARGWQRGHGQGGGDAHPNCPER